MASTYEALLLAQTSQLAVPVTVAPKTTSSSGTMTPAGGSNPGTETFDAVLGYYQVTLIAGRRYLAVMNGLLCGASVANDVYGLLLRNSGTSSNPTSASTQVAGSQWVAAAAGGAGEQSMALAGSFIAPATGTNTFGFSAQRKSGTGAFTPLGTRELYVMYLGAV